MSLLVGRPLAGPPHGLGDDAGTRAADAAAFPGEHPLEVHPCPHPLDEHPHPHLHVRPHPRLHAASVPASEDDSIPPVAEPRPTQPSRGVVVDIGEDIGALVLYADAEREWLEPEIHPVEEPALRQHVWVLERIVGAGSVYAAVFPSLPEGRYGICSPDGSTAQEVEINGGKVTEARWL